MKILLLGKNGQVGWELQRSLQALGEIHAYDIPEIDLANLPALRTQIQTTAPNIIVNAAAYTAVDKAETDIEQCALINRDAVDVIAEEASALDAWLVHYSTDYVFDGTQSVPYLETDAPNPCSVYGKTKLAGEIAIQEKWAKHLIFRTSWVYAAHGGNFAKTILRLAREREGLRIINDQYGAPTGAELLADITALALQKVLTNASLAGLYHLAPRGETTWFAYAQTILAYAAHQGYALKTTAETLTPIATTEYPLPAVRPQSSRLNTTKLEAAFGFQLPHWQAPLQRMLDEFLLTKEAA